MVACLRRYKKRGLGKVILRRNGLQQRIIQPYFQGTNGRGITFKGLSGKSIYLVQVNLHGISFEKKVEWT